MTRQERYPDTSTFHFYNANPKNKYTTDCVIRAIATATGIPYYTVVMEMAEMQCKTGFDGADVKLYGKYLESKGWKKQSQPRKQDNTKYTGEEWCNKLRAIHKANGSENNIIAHIGGHHVVCIKDFKVFDTWDSTDGCIGNYWIKE